MGLRGEAFYLGRAKARERENHAPVGIPRLPNEGVPFPLKKCSRSWETVRLRDQSIVAAPPRRASDLRPQLSPTPAGFSQALLGPRWATADHPSAGAAQSSPTGRQQIRRKGAQPLRSWGRSLLSPRGAVWSGSERPPT